MIKRFFLISLFGLSCNMGCSPAFAAQLNINMFRGNDRDNDPLMVKNGMSPNSQNVVTDNVEGLGPRSGFTRFSTETCSSGPWDFPISNGNRYLITLSSNVLKATLGGTSFTIVLSTVDGSVRTPAASLGDKFFWASADGLKYWDTSITSHCAPGLNFDNLVAHKGRLAGSGVTGDRRTIYVSKYLDGTDFNLKVNPTDDDPTRLQVQGSLDEYISGLFSSYQDALIWFKANSFGAIYGSRRSNFQSVVYSPNVGSAYPESVKDCDGELRFLGSRRAIWGFNGKSVNKLTKEQNSTAGIDTLMNTLIQGDANSRSWTQSAQSDWALGTARPNIDFVSSPGDVVLQSQSSITVPTDNFNDGDYTNNPTWTVRSGVYGVVGGALTTLSCAGGGVPESISIQSTFSTGTWILTGTLLGGSVGDTEQYYFMSSDDPSIGSTGDIGNRGFLFRVSKSVIALDYRDHGTNITLVSSNTVVGAITKISVTRSDAGVFISSFSDGSGTDIPMKVVTQSTPTFSQYFVMRNNADTCSPTPASLDSVSVTSAPYVLSSTFTSQSFNMGPTATAWGVFTANHQLGGGAVTYALYSDTNNSLNIDNPTTFIASQTIVSGNVPSIALSSYVAVAMFFSKPLSTQAVAVNDFTINWVDGNQLRASSLWTNQRYWLGCAVGTATANNTVLVMDRNRQWQYWTGINMTGAVMYNGLPYFGNNTGIYQAESGYSDNGSAIPVQYFTQAYYPSQPNYRSIFDNLYLTTTNSAETLQVQYFIDGVSTAFSLPSLVMNTVSGYQDLMLPFSSTNLLQGKTVQFKFSVNSTTNWRVLNASLYYSSDPALDNN